MKRELNRQDVIIAVAIAAFVLLLSFLWAYPYPHPNLWPTLSALRFHVSVSTLSVFGHIGLSFFAALTYLLMRIVWLGNLEPEDEFPDNFLFARIVPLLGTLGIVLAPPVWRSAQHLSFPFLCLFVLLIAVLLWLLSRGFRGVLTYSTSYLLFGVLAMVNPLALAVFLYVFCSDVISRWQNAMYHGQSEDDAKQRRKRILELTLSVAFGLTGLAIGVLSVARYRRLSDFSWSIPSIFSDWLGCWTAAFDESLVSPFMLTVGALTLLAIVGMAFGRRIRAVGGDGFIMAAALTTVLAVVVLGLTLRAHDGDARKRLALIKEFVAQVEKDVGDAKWFFTDGRLDDMLRYAFAKTGRKTHILDVLHQPTEEEANRYRSWAPTYGERDMFASGGSELFRAWARETPEHLAESAWFIGSGIIKQFGKSSQVTCGSVLRAKPETDVALQTYASADGHMKNFQNEVLSVVSTETLWGRVFGGVDGALAEKFDAVMWRIGRQAITRAEILSSDGDVQNAQKLRDVARQLNLRNGSLRVQGAALERLLPSANIVLTSKEALNVSLKRADFALAQRYAHEVLVKEPDDPSANFALGMAGLAAKDYFAATRHLEKVVQVLPKEPAALNNLALAYLKLGFYEKAKVFVERAAQLHPKSTEVQQNLREIEKAYKASRAE